MAEKILHLIQKDPLGCEGFDALANETDEKFSRNFGGKEGLNHRLCLQAGDEFTRYLRTMGERNRKGWMHGGSYVIGEGCALGIDVSDRESLPFSVIIEAVLCDWEGGNVKEEACLKRCYLAILSEAEKFGARRLLLPPVGVLGHFFSPRRAANVAFKAVKEYLEKHPDAFSDITWAIESQKIYEIFSDEMLHLHDFSRAHYLQEKSFSVNPQEDWGLVLAGGGGKGSYEAGEMKALEKLTDKGLFPKIRAVSGTSVGALNAAMFSIADSKELIRLWSQVRKEDLFDIDSVLRSDKKLYRAVRDVCDVNSKIGGFFYMNAAAYVNCFRKLVLGRKFHPKEMEKLDESTKKIMLLLVHSIVSRAFFSRGGMQKMIRGFSVPKKVQESDILCFVTCHNKTNHKAQEFLLNNQSRAMIEKLLLATTAIPSGVYPAEKIEGIEYCDGGTSPNGDNVPIGPLYQLGYRKFLVLHLRSCHETYCLSHDDKVNLENYERSYPDGGIFFHVFPEEDMGDLWEATLNFSQEAIQKNITLGYTEGDVHFKSLPRFVSVVPEKGKECHYCNLDHYEVAYESTAAMIDSFAFTAP